jgi:hypothetical protein
LIFISCHYAFANESSYIVENIDIIEEAESASKARQLANINANRQSFINLLKRLSIDESFSNYIDDEQLEEAIIAKKIENEKIANNWYKARFNIEFSKDYIDHLLEAKDEIDYSDLGLNKKYLIFPIEIKNKKPIIWHNNNIWFSAWRDVLKDRELDNIIMPQGNIDDISLLELKDIDKIKYSDIKDILEKYDSKIGAFINIYIDNLEYNASININLIKKFTKQKIRLKFRNINDIKKDHLYPIIAKKIIEHLESKNNKSAESIESKNKKYIDVDVISNSLKKWVILKQNLNKIENIDFKIISISSDLIKLILMPINDEIEVIKELGNNNIKIEQNDKDDDVYYILLD